MDTMKYFSAGEIKGLERFYRSNLINSITGYKPANLIGTYSNNNIPNLALFTSLVHIGADPPLLGFIQRPIGEFSHTYKNITRNGFYTVNHVHEDFIEKAHYTSAKFEEDVSEFEKCKLTEERFKDFKAPFVKESRIKMGMEFIKEIPIELNNTILIIGKIQHLFVDSGAISKNGNVNLNTVNDVCISGLETYHKVSELKSFPYAKVNNLPKFI